MIVPHGPQFWFGISKKVLQLSPFLLRWKCTVPIACSTSSNRAASCTLGLRRLVDCWTALGPWTALGRYLDGAGTDGTVDGAALTGARWQFDE
jgi:hypothetical protein